MGQYALFCGVERLYSMGELSRHSSDVMGAKGKHCHSIEQLIAALSEDLATDRLHPYEQISVLVKGSRIANMQRVVEALMQAPELAFSRVEAALAC